MSKLLFLLPLGVFLVLLAWHCARRNGWGFWWLFFVCAFFFGVVRGNAVGLISDVIFGQPKPYGFDAPLLKFGYTSLAEPFGWIFAMYGSWFLAEAMLKKAKGWSGQVFPVAFLATLMMGAFSYAVEVAATLMGWWHWRLFAVADKFFYAVPAIGILDWASVAVDFLLPFLLFLCPAVRRSRWRYALPVIFIAHMATHTVPVSVGPLGALFDVWHWASILAIVVGVVVAGCRLVPETLAGRRIGLCRREGSDKFDIIPFAAVATLVAIVSYAVIAKSGDMKLLFSVLPLVVGMLLAAPRVPVWPVVVALALGIFIWLRSFGGYLLTPFALAMFLVCYMKHETPGRRTFSWGAILLALVLGGMGYYIWMPSEHRSESMDQWRTRVSTQPLTDWAYEVADARRVYPDVAKLAGGDVVLFAVLVASRKAGDRTSFDWALGEYETLGYAKTDADALWQSSGRRELQARLKALKPPH